LPAHPDERVQLGKKILLWLGIEPKSPYGFKIFNVFGEGMLTTALPEHVCIRLVVVYDLNLSIFGSKMKQDLWRHR
jgi:hypothetical protein